jgi:hypothetical protein
MKLFLNTYTAALLIYLSGDVENNPGPFDTKRLRSTVNCTVINARSLTSMYKTNDEVFSNMNCTYNFLIAENTDIAFITEKWLTKKSWTVRFYNQISSISFAKTQKHLEVAECCSQ